MELMKLDLAQLSWWLAQWLENPLEIEEEEYETSKRLQDEEYRGYSVNNSQKEATM